MNSLLNQSLTIVLALFLFVNPSHADETLPICTELQKLTASDGGGVEYFGNAVAISGNTVVVGKYYERINVQSSASVYAYRFNGTNWIEQKLVAPDGELGDQFGRSLAVGGNVIVVGAFLDDDLGEDTGSAYVYRWNGTSWVIEQKLVGTGQYGWSVAVDGNVIAIGAHYLNATYVYRFNGSSWVEEQILFPAPSVSNFGESVAVKNDRIVVGAPYDYNTGFGSAYVFKWNGTTWVEEQLLLPSEREFYIFLATAVAISEDLIVVGAPWGFDENYNDAPGAAFVFRWTGTTWVEEAKLTAPDGTSFDWFGASVGAGEDAVVVGKQNGYSGAYLFEWDGNSWLAHKMLGSDTLPGDNFGYSVAMSGNLVAVGALTDEWNVGSAYIFSCLEHGNTPPIVSCPEPITFECDADGTMTLAVSVQDLDGDPLTVTWFVNDLIVQTHEIPSGGSVTQASDSFQHPYHLGDFEVRVAVNDGDLLSECGTVVTAVDHTAPVIVVLEDITVETDPGECFASNVDLGTPQVSDNCEVASVINDAPSIFQKGTTDVHWTASDASNLTTSFTQHVTVIDREAPAIACPASDATFAKESNICGAAFDLPVSEATDNCTLVSFTHDAPAFFPVGVTLVTWTATDDSGNTQKCMQLVTVTNQSPVAVSSGDLNVNTQSSSGTIVQLNAAASFDPDDTQLSYQWNVSGVNLDDPTSPTPSGLFPVGITMATVTVTDGCGAWSTADVTVAVEQVAPPEVICTSDIAALWPPNHKMREVTIYIMGADSLVNSQDIVPIAVLVSSDEPDDANGNGDGNTTGDVNGQANEAQITSLFTFDPSVGESGAWVATIQLRAERAGNGDGRCYTIEVIAIDQFMNSAQTTCCIVVPRG